MNISGLGSTSSWYTRQWSAYTSTTDSGGTSASSSDTASISTQGFAALLNERQGPPPMTDEQAAEIGGSLKEKNAKLFSALDTDQDGTLTADELKAGMDALRGNGGKPSGPPPSGKPPEGSDEEAATIGTQLQQDNAALFSVLDSDQDGTLSAAELKAGNDTLRQAMGPPPAPPSGDGQDGDQGDAISQILSSLSQSGSSLSEYQQNLLNDLLQSIGTGTTA